VPGEGRSRLNTQHTATYRTGQTVAATALYLRILNEICDRHTLAKYTAVAEQALSGCHTAKALHHLFGCN
jgi:hypothetical protein